MGSVVKLFIQPANRIRRLIRIGRLCRRVRPLLSREYRRVFRRAVRLCRQERFLPDEAFRLAQALNQGRGDQQMRNRYERTLSGVPVTPHTARFNRWYLPLDALQ